MELLRQILQLDPNARPKADELERIMQSIAISTISQRIGCLYTHICEQADLPQAFIEQMQFESLMKTCKALYISKD